MIQWRCPLSGDVSQVRQTHLTTYNDDSGGAHYQVMLAGETNYLTTYNDLTVEVPTGDVIGETNYLTTYNGQWRCPLSGDVSR